MKKYYFLLVLLFLLVLPLKATVSGIVSCKFDKEGTVLYKPDYNVTVTTNSKTKKRTLLTDAAHTPRVSVYEDMVKKAATSKYWTECAYVKGIYKYWQTFPDSSIAISKLTKEQKIAIIRRTYEVMEYMASRHLGNEKKHGWFFYFLGEIRQPLCEEVGVCNGNEHIGTKDDDTRYVYTTTNQKSKDNNSSGLGTSSTTGPKGNDGSGNGGNGGGDNGGGGGQPKPAHYKISHCEIFQ